MSIYKLIIYFFGLLPIIQLILIGMILIKTGGKVSIKIKDLYKLITFEIIMFLISTILPVNKGVAILYLLFTLVVGIPLLIFQYSCYKSLDKENQLVKMTASNIVWGIIILLGLVYWIIYFATNLLNVAI